MVAFFPSFLMYIEFLYLSRQISFLGKYYFVCMASCGGGCRPVVPGSDSNNCTFIPVRETLKVMAPYDHKRKRKERMQYRRGKKVLRVKPIAQQAGIAHRLSRIEEYFKEKNSASKN